VKILSVFGTRPEAIKMAPLVNMFKTRNTIDSTVCVTGQHREMLDQTLKIFDIEPDYDLNIMKAGQTLTHITSAVLEGTSNILETIKPDYMLVHGDVTTGVAAAMAAFYHKIPVAHIEAGLRTGNILSPYPEEMNRKLIGSLSTYHFAPTEKSKNNLVKENIDPKNIFVTGNTVIDALLWVRDKIHNNSQLITAFKKRFNFLDSEKKLILVTGHRRENFDGGLENVCYGLKHLNPHVKKITQDVLKDIDNIFLIEPQDYVSFVYLMDQSYIIVTDSGGIQEEAPSLGKPVLVTRDTTERPEAIEAGTVKLIGTSREALEQELSNLISNKTLYKSMQEAHNPYGDGKACERITDFFSHIK